jgi:hypothetical protein
VDSPRGVIEAFLAGQAGPVCVECLATAVSLPASQVSMVMQRLASLGTFKSQVGICVRCHQQRTVLKAA